MFDKLIDVFLSIWEWFIPFFVIDEYERGVVLQFGKYRRTVGPGIWLMCPFGIDDAKYETVVRQTADLVVQSLTTLDKKSVSLKAIVIFKIVDIKKFLLQIDEGEVDVMNMVIGVISDTVELTRWEDIPTKEFNRKVLKASRHICEKYCGVKILAIKWSDKTTARSIRLWND